MREIVAEDHPFVRKEVSADEARAQFKDQPYKLELIDGLEQGGFDEYGHPLADKPAISFYVDGPFVDLCRGPHVESTGQVNPAAFKLLNIAGAYWRGDEKNKQLQRIYGTAWATGDELEQHLWRLEEARRRDHRKLGRELGLFTISQEVGPGLPLWLPKGAMLRDTLERFLREEQLERGYLRSSRRTSAKSIYTRRAVTGTPTATACSRRWRRPAPTRTRPTRTARCTCSSR